MVAGAALVFLTAIKELPATLLLAPIGFDTLATEIWRATSVGFFERGAVPSLVLLAVSAGRSTCWWRREGPPRASLTISVPSR